MSSTHTVSVEITSGSGTWTVPDGITLIYVTLIGGGGGGGGGSNIQSPWGAGGSSEFGLKVPLKVTPGSGIFYSIGAAGIGGYGANADHGKGYPAGDTSFGPYFARGGGGGGNNINTNNYMGGWGGGVGGTQGHGAVEQYLPSGAYVGGGFSGGSCGQAAPDSDGAVIPPAAGSLGRIGGLGGEPHSGRAGPGGGSSPYGQGGQGGGDIAFTSSTDGNPPAAGCYGAGGGSSGKYEATQRHGGDGLGGYIMLQWIG